MTPTASHLGLAADSSTPEPDPDAVLAAACAHMQPGAVYEARIPKLRQRWGKGARVGYFDGPQRLAAAVACIMGADAEGVYWTLNPVNPALLARAANRFADGISATADDDIPRLTRLLIDVDAHRPSGISASDDERRAAHATCRRIRTYLMESGWPEPAAMIDSGNGGHLYYAVDLPNDADERTRCERALKGLAALFNDAAAAVDTVVFNPARIAKIPGTVAAKGDHTPDRPWRLTSGQVTPTPEIVSPDLLDALAAHAPAEPVRAPHDASSRGQRGWDIRDVLRDSGISYREKTTAYGTVYELDRCLTSSDHDDGAVIIEMTSGALAYRCLHNRCRGRGWADVRDQLRIPQRSATEPTRLHIAGQAAGDASPAAVSMRAAPAPEPWPVLAPEALIGLAGDVVRALDPTTEADPVAVLVTFLVMFGNAVNRGPHLMIGDDRHGTNVFAVLVGDTSAARKGTSQAGPRRLMSLVDSTWAAERVQGGLSTGEGLLMAIRDARYGTNKKGETVLEDAGVADKRLLCIEEELSFLLKTGQRQGNTITEIIRRAWDSRDTLRVMTKGSPTMATKPHVSILGHITRAELARHLTETELANGFANRYAWFAVKRSKALPEPVRLPDEQAAALARRIQAAYSAALLTGEMKHDTAARDAWRAVYPALSAGQPGLGGALTARGAPIVRRLSLVYALLDSSRIIGRPHLEAAIALWQYAEASVRLIFGDLTGDPIADRILAMTRRQGRLTQGDLHNLFGRNISAAQLGQAIELLTEAGRITVTREAPDGRGRPATIIAAA